MKADKEHQFLERGLPIVNSSLSGLTGACREHSEQLKGQAGDIISLSLGTNGWCRH